MTEHRPGGDRSYKRSWKNLLINKSYQLRFTLFMVGLAALLMVCLGVWVMQVANEATTVAMSSVLGESCPRAVPELAPPAPSAPPGTPAAPGAAGAAVVPPGTPAAPDVRGAAGTPEAAPAGGAGVAGADPAGGGGGAAPAPAAPGGDEPRRSNVRIDESSMTLTPPPAAPPPPPVIPSNLADRVSAQWTCELALAGRIEQLERGRLQILWGMIAIGALLVLGLAAYGLKMTHRVAGPLFKVSLYLSKMRQGRFDTVYNLRKGDQLVEFYDHFKRAHGGVVASQRADIDRLAQVIAAAEAAGLGAHPAVAELRELAHRKEKSIE